MATCLRIRVNTAKEFKQLCPLLEATQVRARPFSRQSHVLMAILAGILCAIVSHPADVLVSKLNANRGPGEAFGAAVKRIYGDIGFPGLWNGLVLRIFMIGTLTSLQWGIYDSWKVALGLPTTGGAAPPAKN